MFEDLFVAMRLRRFWMLDAWLGISVRHRTSALGFIWHLLPTIIFVGTVGTIFKHVMEGTNSFFIYLLTGLVIWTPINHVLTGAPDCYRTNKPFLLSGGLNLIIFNLKLNFEAIAYMLIQSILILFSLLYFYENISLDFIYSIFGIIALYLLLIPLSISLALIGARFQDFSEAFRAIVRILFLSTPIIWEVSNDGRLAKIEQLLWVNPFFFAIELIRGPLIGQQINHAYWVPFIGHILFAWIVAILLYNRLKGTTTLWL